MIDRTSGLSGRNLARAAMAGLLGLAVAGSTTAPATARQAASVCRVQFTGFSTVLYNTDLDLTGFIIKGNHNYSAETRSGGQTSTDFEVLDNDGFLTLYVLLNEWRASGKLQRNLTEVVAYPRSDIMLALDAIGMGITYHQTIITKAEADRPADLVDVKRLLALKLESLKMMQEGLRRASAGSGDTVELPPGFFSARMGLILDGVLGGPGQVVMAQYLDRPSGSGPNILCDPTAPSAFVGQLLCGFKVTNGAVRDPAVCPDGIRLNALSSLPRCSRVGGQDRC